MSSLCKRELIFFYLTERFNTSFILFDSSIFFYLNRKQIKNVNKNEDSKKEIGQI